MKNYPISLRVNQLEMSDFRGFKHCTLEFSKNIQTTVFVGVNGAGKSTVLDCIVILLSWFKERLESEKKSDLKKGLFPNYDDLRIGSQHDDIAIDVEFNREEIPRYSLSHYYADAERPLLWPIDLDTDLWEIIRRVSQGELLNLPIIIYYRTNRYVLETPLEYQPDLTYNQLHAYEDALDIHINFHAFFRWFRDREDNENAVRSRKDSNYKDRQLQAIRSAITNFSSLDGFSDLVIHRDPKPEGMLVTKDIGGSTQELKLNQLSDGEKCLIAMIADIARRLAIANPGLDDPLQGHGVVLIDEIELHMHPKWQRNIIPDLERTFPNIQFIVTTHSPQVLSNVLGESIIFLEQTPEGIIAHDPTSLYGRDSNQILERFMRVDERPTKIKKDIQRLFQLIDQGDLEKAKKLRKSLEKKIGQVDDFLTADALIKRKELIGK